MSWEWSHTGAALDEFDRQVQALPRRELIVLCAEWSAFLQQRGEDGYTGHDDANFFDADCYESALEFFANLDTETLIAAVRASSYEHRTCDNGGHRLWCCPYGCHGITLEGEGAES